MFSMLKFVAGFAMRNLKLALIGAVVAGVATLTGVVWRAGYNARVTHDVKEQTRILRERLETMEVVKSQDDLRAAHDAARLQELEKLANATPKNDAACLDAAARDRVHDVRDGKAGPKRPAPSAKPAKPPGKFQKLFHRGG